MIPCVQAKHTPFSGCKEYATFMARLGGTFTVYRWTNHSLFSFSIAGLLLAAMPSSASNHSGDKLARIFRYEMLGARIAYVESFAGPAMRINDDKSRQYEIDGCNVTI